VKRWQQARRSMDAAMYADDSTDEQIKELTKEAMAAQSDLLKERTLTEYMIRKVLTPEQLVRFRELRDSLIQRMTERKNAANEDATVNEPQRPFNRLRQRRQNRGQ
jgi:Spy/CpxP family protein refolding chaperone